MRREAQRRAAYVTDTGLSISGVFSKGEALKEHMAALIEATEYGDE